MHPRPGPVSRNGGSRATALGARVATVTSVVSVQAPTIRDAVIEYLVDGENRRVGKKANGVPSKGWIFRDALQPVADHLHRGR